jgi:hypothetical protein
MARTEKQLKMIFQTTIIQYIQIIVSMKLVKIFLKKVHRLIIILMITQAKAEINLRQQIKVILVTDLGQQLTNKIQKKDI